jgi:hypothetical protein
MKINSLEIKYALMYYFRFKRQWLCASECLNNDVMVITNKDIIEVEIKINKYDLWKGEEKKNKHKYYKDINNSYWRYYRKSIPNKFYICVPMDLEKEAENWIKNINNKYGIILYHPYLHVQSSILIRKSADRLHNEDRMMLRESIMKRVCSENIGLIGNILERK